MAPQARAAFGRAVELLRAEGDVTETVRALRAKAWSIATNTDREDPSGVDRALALFGEALRELDHADDPAGFAGERANTHHQLAHLLARADRLAPAHTAADRAAEAFAALLPDEAPAYLDAVQLAARIEAFGQDERPAALARLDAALAVCEAAGVTDTREASELRAELAKD